MKTNKMLVIAAMALVGCGSVEGKYTLDKAETKKEMEAEIAKLPAAEQESEKKGLDFIEAMDMSVELKSGGDATMSMTIKGFGDGKPKEETGKWKKDGDEVTITDDKNKEMKCTKSGKSLKCTDTSGKHKNTTVFTKV